MWLSLPSTSSPSAPAPSTPSLSASSWQFQTLASSATLSETHSAPRVWFGRWKKAAWMQRLCGAMPEPSTAGRGADAWIASLRASRARGTALRESGCSPTTPATCGPRHGESFGSWSAAGSSSKTSTGSWFRTGTLMPVPLSPGYSESWPRMGGMRSGECFQRRKLERPTSGRESFCWPTATEGDSTNTANATAGRLNPNPTHQVGYMLVDASRAWQTPSTRDEHGHTVRGGDRADEPMLAGQAKQWPTPNAADQDNHKAHKRGNPTLPTAADRVLASARPTPAGRDHKGTNDPSHMDRSTGSMHLDQLPNFVAHCLPPPLATSKAGVASSKSTRRLNPRFVCWLMGWPMIVGTGSAPWATEWSLFKSRMRGQLSRLLSRRAAE